MSYHLAADRAQHHEQLLAAITTAIHALDITSWATRAVKASDALHAAGYHLAALDPDGCVVQTDWRDCPSCSMHPERLATVGGEAR